MRNWIKSTIMAAIVAVLTTISLPANLAYAEGFGNCVEVQGASWEPWRLVCEDHHYVERRHHHRPPRVVYQEPKVEYFRFEFESYSGPAYRAPRYHSHNRRDWNQYYRQQHRTVYPNNPAPGVHRVGPTHYRVNGALVSTKSAGCGDRMINAPGIGLAFICE